MPVAVWRRIEPHLPANGKPGKQWKSHRAVINGILWRLRTGCPWRDVPERYGPWQTAYSRFRSWELDGTLGAAVHRDSGRGRRGRGNRVDRLGRLRGGPGAPARRRGTKRGGAVESTSPPTAQAAVHPEPDHHGLGRSLGFVVTEGQASDIAHAQAALEAVAVPTPRGPARTRPGVLLGDKAYSSRAFRNYLRRRKIRHVIPEPDNQKANRVNKVSAGSSEASPPATTSSAPATRPEPT